MRGISTSSDAERRPPSRRDKGAYSNEPGRRPALQLGNEFGESVKPAVEPTHGSRSQPPYRVGGHVQNEDGLCSGLQHDPVKPLPAPVLIREARRCVNRVHRIAEIGPLGNFEVVLILDPIAATGVGRPD